MQFEQHWLADQEKRAARRSLLRDTQNRGKVSALAHQGDLSQNGREPTGGSGAPGLPWRRARSENSPF